MPTEERPDKQGRTEGKTHLLGQRVYYEDTDAGGVVYYANYMRFLERGRTELLRVMGWDHQNLRREHGLIFAVKRCMIDYVAAARLDDWLEIATKIVGLGGATLDMKQIIRHEGRVLTEADIRLVSLSVDNKVLRLPDGLRKTAESWIDANS